MNQNEVNGGQTGRILNKRRYSAGYEVDFGISENKGKIGDPEKPYYADIELAPGKKRKLYDASDKNLFYLLDPYEICKIYIIVTEEGKTQSDNRCTASNLIGCYITRCTSYRTEKDNLGSNICAKHKKERNPIYYESLHGHYTTITSKQLEENLIKDYKSMVEHRYEKIVSTIRGMSIDKQNSI